ncbi:MAG: hypothetical protein V3575_05655 [Candidatus Absconditabacteria bacterium]
MALFCKGNVSIEGEKVVVLNVWGTRNRIWTIQDKIVKPYPVVRRLMEIIDEVTAQGEFKKLHGIGVSPQVMIKCLFDGLITEKDLYSARVYTNNIIIYGLFGRSQKDNCLNYISLHVSNEFDTPTPIFKK